MGLEDIFPGLPPTPGDVMDGIGDFFSGIGDFFSGSGPSAQSIAVGRLVKTIFSGPGGSGMYQAYRATKRQMDIQTDLAGQAHELVGRLEAAWSGSSSDPARQLIRGFADAADESSKVLSNNARNLERQVEGFQRMHDSLEVMPDPPPTKSAFNPDFSGAARRRIRRYNQMADRNRQRYQSYVDETNDNLDRIDYDHAPLPSNRGSDNWQVKPSPSRSGSGVPMPPRLPGPEPYTPGGGSGYTPPSYQPEQYTPGGYDPSYSGTTAAAAFGPGSAGGGAGGFGPGAGGGMPGGGVPGGMAGFGPEGASGAASGVAQGGAAGAGAAGRGAGAGGFGPRGGGGMMGGAPMGGGAGRGQGGDDEEHARKSWLQENDPEGLFGSDELTPPPVIGDDDYE